MKWNGDMQACRATSSTEIRFSLIVANVLRARHKLTN